MVFRDSFPFGIGILAALVIALNIVGVLGSAGGCVLRASMPSVLVAGGFAVLGLLFGSFAASRLGKRVNFCADSTGRICFTPKGRYSVVNDGRCEQCQPLD